MFGEDLVCVSPVSPARGGERRLAVDIEVAAREAERRVLLLTPFDPWMLLEPLNGKHPLGFANPSDRILSSLGLNGLT